MSRERRRAKIPSSEDCGEKARLLRSIVATIPTCADRLSMSDHSRIVILDFGSQYTQVIARRIRECQVYSQIVPYHTRVKEIAKLNPRGLILSGGPASVYGKKAPHPDPEIFELGVPVLGICYGVQLMAHLLGGKVEHSAQRE